VAKNASITENSESPAIENKVLSLTEPLVVTPLATNNKKNAAEYNVKNSVKSSVSNVAAPVQEQIPASPKVTYYDNKSDALAALMRYTTPQSLPIKSGAQQACDRLRLLLFRCETVNEPNWQAFKKYNRPAIITLREYSRLSHVVVVGIVDDSVLVIADDPNQGQQQGQQKEALVFTRLAINDLEKQWAGEATFIWQAPLGFERYIFKNSNGVLIDWLAKAFAIIDKKNEVLAKGQYNRLLEKRIRLFQKKYDLNEDGKAGMETLLKLNEVLGIAMTLDGGVVVSADKSAAVNADKSTAAYDKTVGQLQ